MIFRTSLSLFFILVFLMPLTSCAIKIPVIKPKSTNVDEGNSHNGSRIPLVRIYDSGRKPSTSTRYIENSSGRNSSKTTFIAQQSYGLQPKNRNVDPRLTAFDQTLKSVYGDRLRTFYFQNSTGGFNKDRRAVAAIFDQIIGDLGGTRISNYRDANYEISMEASRSIPDEEKNKITTTFTSRFKAGGMLVATDIADVTCPYYSRGAQYCVLNNSQAREVIFRLFEETSR